MRREGTTALRALSCGGFLAASMLLCSPAAAQTWIHYATNASGSEYRYETTTLERRGRQVRVWGSADHRNNRDGRGSSPYVETLYVIDCASRTYTREWMQSFDAFGGRVHSWRPSQSGHVIPSNSPMGALARAVCRP